MALILAVEHVVDCAKEAIVGHVKSEVIEKAIEGALEEVAKHWVHSLLALASKLSLAYEIYEFTDCLVGPDSSTQGDPHVRTFDGHSYDFQAIGEFIHNKTLGLEVQVRFEGIKGHNTRTVATAVRAGPHVVESYLRPASPEQDSFSVIIDGSTRLLDFDGISFGDGTFVARRHGSRNSDDNVLIVDPAGSYVLIENGFRFCQNVKVSLAHDTKTTGGLSGVLDGDTSNDFRLRDGTAMSLEAAKTVDGLYGRFAQSWRVRPEERLFTRGAASDFLTDEYTSLPAKMTRLSDFSEAEIEKARGECRKRGVQGALLDDCIYDVLATNDVAWADQAATSAAAWSLTGNAPSVVRNAIDIEAPQRVAAGSTLEFPWKGPDAPNGVIFIAPPSMASNAFFPEPKSHATQKGSPAKLVAPAQPGSYEIRYFSGGDVMSRTPLTVTDPEVRVDAPGTVVAGSTLEVAWKGPNAPNDLIFIATPSMASNEYFPEPKSHATQKGSPAKLVAPFKAGRYEIRYFSHTNGAVLARFPLAVTSAGEVRLDAPGTVAAGSTLEVAWKGPNAPNDFIFIATPSMASNAFFPGHATQKGSPAKLVAPAKAGSYEIRYFSSANGAVLKKRALVVH